MKRHILWIVVTALVLGGVSGCSGAQSGQTSEPVVAEAVDATFTAVVSAPTSPPSHAEPAPMPSTVIYIVKSGDTLARIATTFGVPLAALIETNGIENPDAIEVGQKLTIPQPLTEGVAPTSVAAVSSIAVSPGMVAARVVTVVDGDTIVVSIGDEEYKVRYIGINCPETVHPQKVVECMGPEAAEANKKLVDGKHIYLEKDMSETDKYGRLLRYVWVGDVLINAELVRLGYAQASTYPPDVKYQDLFLESQQEARNAGRGLWAASLGETNVPTVIAITTSSPCSCSGNLYNCPDFSTPAEAQACYKHCMQVTGYDVHELDRDKDGIACESWTR